MPDRRPNDPLARLRHALREEVKAGVRRGLIPAESIGSGRPSADLRTLPLEEIGPVETAPGSFGRGVLLGECRVIVAEEPGIGWHLSISHPRRLPNWAEIAEARYRLVPDGATMTMILPPREAYINLHNFCLHLWERRDGEDGRG